jgi:YD repeat-containing protein
MTDRTGTTTYGYNTITVPPTLGAGRLATVTGPLPNSTVAYNYDQLGRMTNRSINAVAQTVTLDSLGRPTIITNALGTFAPPRAATMPLALSAASTSQQPRAEEFDPSGQRAELGASRQQTGTASLKGDTTPNSMTSGPDGEIPSSAFGPPKRIRTATADGKAAGMEMTLKSR